MPGARMTLNGGAPKEVPRSAAYLQRTDGITVLYAADHSVLCARRDNGMAFLPLMRSCIRASSRRRAGPRRNR